MHDMAIKVLSVIPCQGMTEIPSENRITINGAGFHVGVENFPGKTEPIGLVFVLFGNAGKHLLRVVLRCQEAPHKGRSVEEFKVPFENTNEETPVVKGVRTESLTVRMLGLHSLDVYDGEQLLLSTPIKFIPMPEGL